MNLDINLLRKLATFIAIQLSSRRIQLTERNVS